MSSFQERQKSLFNQLKDAEEQHSFAKTNKAVDPPNYDEVDRQMYRKLKREMKQFRGKESIYKRPGAKLRDRVSARTIPDHMKHPEKYVYYSLADVTADQMSDATNAATAFALMKRLEEQEASKTEMDHDSDEFIFKKPVFQVSSTFAKKEDSPPDQKVVFKSRKVVMPEYVVGVTKKKEKKIVKKESKDSADTKKKVELKLNHLYDDED